MNPAISRLRSGPARALLLAGLVALATVGFAQTAEMAADPTNPAAAGIVPPSSLETSGSAFAKLDPDGKGYVGKDDTKQLPGFDVAFQRADVNNDSRLTPDEFNQAWAIYQGH